MLRLELLPHHWSDSNSSKMCKLTLSDSVKFNVWPTILPEPEQITLGGGAVHIVLGGKGMTGYENPIRGGGSEKIL